MAGPRTFPLRIPDELRPILVKLAALNQRSLNSEIIFRVKQALAQEKIEA